MNIQSLTTVSSFPVHFIKEKFIPTIMQYKIIIIAVAAFALLTGLAIWMWQSKNRMAGKNLCIAGQKLHRQGNAYLSQGNNILAVRSYDAAINDFEASLRLAPNDTLTILAYIQFLHYTKDNTHKLERALEIIEGKLATETFKKIDREMSKHPSTFLQLQKMFSDVDLKDYEVMCYEHAKFLNLMGHTKLAKEATEKHEAIEVFTKHLGLFGVRGL